MPFRVFLCLLFLLLWPAAEHLSAAPTPPVGPVRIEGTIAELKWLPERHVPGVPRMSGSAGRDRTFPAHYAVTLKNVRVTGLNARKFEGARTVEINLNHPADDSFLRRGMRIVVEDYVEKGDEGGTWTSFKSIGKIE